MDDGLMSWICGWMAGWLGGLGRWKIDEWMGLIDGYVACWLDGLGGWMYRLVDGLDWLRVKSG